MPSAPVSVSGAMSRQTLLTVLGGAVVAGVILLGTQYVLGLFPSGGSTEPGAEEASFLAHLLLPLWVALAFFAGVAAVGGLVRWWMALWRDASGDASGE